MSPATSKTSAVNALRVNIGFATLQAAIETALG